MIPDRVALPLRYHTPDEWAERAMTDLVALLDDHAHLERKAATNALELLGRWPNPAPPKGWSQTLASVARDETDHLHKVTRLLAERGAFMSRIHRNPYAHALRGLVRLGLGNLELMDRLMVCSLIELRSCERFEILGRTCTEPKLVKLYTGLWASEHSHYKVFLKLARELNPAPVVEERWSEMLDAEAAIIAGQTPGCRMHSGLG